MHSNSSGSEQYCVTCQQNRQTWGQDNRICVVCKKKSWQVSPTPSSHPSKNQEGKCYLSMLINSLQGLTLGEQKAEPSARCKSKSWTASWGMKWSLCKGKFLKTHMPPNSCLHKRPIVWTLANTGWDGHKHLTSKPWRCRQYFIALSS